MIGKIRHECVNQKTMRHSPCHGKVESFKEFLTGFEEGERKDEGTPSWGKVSQSMETGTTSGVMCW